MTNKAKGCRTGRTKHPMHGFDNMSFRIVWSTAKYFPSKGSWENVLTPSYPRQFGSACFWAKPLAWAHQHHWRPCHSQQDSLQTSLVPIVLSTSILGLPISVKCAPPFWVFTCSRWLARWGSAADTHNAPWAESRPASAAWNPCPCKERACHFSCLYKCWPLSLPPRQSMSCFQNMG